MGHWGVPVFLSGLTNQVWKCSATVEKGVRHSVGQVVQALAASISDVNTCTICRDGEATPTCDSM